MIKIELTNEEMSLLEGALEQMLDDVTCDEPSKEEWLGEYGPEARSLVAKLPMVQKEWWLDKLS